jgi:hypothetical protein
MEYSGNKQNRMLIPSKILFAYSINARFNVEKKRTEKVEWTVVEKEDTQSPFWIKTPSLQDKTYVLYGCGHEKFTHFNLTVGDSNNTECFIEVQLKITQTGKFLTYIIPYNPSKPLKIGHDMCSGSFEYSDNANYQVNFSLIDICGNRVLKTSI